MSSIRLFCLIQGDNPHNIFEVEIEKSESVDNLKEEIKKKKPSAFANVDIEKLWKVNIPLEEQDKVFKAKPCGSAKELDGEELDATKNVTEYFSDEKSIIILHLIIQREQLNVVLFGLTGHGKSTIANMLIQGDIYQQDNLFKVNDGAKGETENIQGSINEMFQVFDTVGLGETTAGSVPHDTAVKRIRDYFSTCEVPLNYILYVKKKGRFTNEDVKMFKTFKKLFEGGEKNIIVIITSCKPGWVKRESETIKKNFGNYPVIPVDFPSDEGDEDDDDYNEDDEAHNHKKRTQSLRRLLDKLSMPECKGVKLEILNSSQKTESNVSQVVDVVPFVGSAYQLISSGVYYKLGKPETAKKRLVAGTTGLAFDVMTVGSIAGKAIATSVGKALIGNLAQRVTMKTVEKHSELAVEEAKEKNLGTNT